MLRQVDLNEISDGRVYHSHDMVKADCNGCKGCSACCRGMGKSITLDPFDIYNLTTNLNRSFDELLSESIELSITDGIILPNLRMGENGSCLFLNSEERCTIHGFRPGLCRLFPLGRFFKDNAVHYILQIYECKNTGRSDVMVHNWIGISDIAVYEDFSCSWHYLLKELQAYITENIDQAKAVNMYILKNFYLNPYDKTDFFEQFNKRKAIVKKALFG